MSQEDYAQAPDTLTVREFKAGGKIMVTTFLCPKEAPKSILKVLYRRRWNIELDLRNIKTWFAPPSNASEQHPASRPEAASSPWN